MRKLSTDVAVIGAGTAGLAAYRAVTAAGHAAVLIEGGVHGTTCARVGCMPSKLLIAPAEARHALDRFPGFGLRVDGDVKVDGKAVMARVRSERDRFVGFVLQGVDGIPAADKLDGYARFEDEHTLVVGEHTALDTKATVIATGSSPVYPAAWASLRDRIVTNETIFEWSDLPESVVVLGPGVIGLELGQALHRLGVRVRVFGRGGGVGPLADPVLRDVARSIFADEFRLETDAGADVWREADAVAVRYRDPSGKTIVEHFDYLLAATGRVSNVAKLGLERTGVARDAAGVPLFDRATMQCGNSSIFIAGDANGEVPLLHEAADEGRIAGENAARFPNVRAGVRRAGLAIVFSDPQIAIVGGGYRAAQASRHVTGAVSFDDQGRARVMQRNRGGLHVYAEIGTGAFLGAEMIGPDAEHLAHLLAWARQLDLTVAEMLALPFYHPVVEEGVRTALRDAYAKLEAAKKERRAA
jgi:dihydrolipoamide dehydrogenase